MDPYKVLGVSRDASDDDIKRTYRDLARKYHPDNYVNNPLADLAQEKMKEINEAYDLIQKERTSGGSARTEQSYTGYSTGAPEFQGIRQMIMAGNLDGAEAALDQIGTHSAEWNFLKGSIALKRGWYDEARRYIETAASMDPQNAEYRSALNQMHGSANYYRTGSRSYASSTGGDCSMCNICSSLMVADCCCECMGGDLVPCC